MENAINRELITQMVFDMCSHVINPHELVRGKSNSKI